MADSLTDLTYSINLVGNDFAFIKNLVINYKLKTIFFNLSRYPEVLKVKRLSFILKTSSNLRNRGRI